MHTVPLKTGAVVSVKFSPNSAKLMALTSSRARFFSISRSMPTANAEDPRRSGGARRYPSHRDLSAATLRLDLALGDRRRQAPKKTRHK